MTSKLPEKTKELLKAYWKDHKNDGVTNGGSTVIVANRVKLAIENDCDVMKIFDVVDLYYTDDERRALNDEYDPIIEIVESFEQITEKDVYFFIGEMTSIKEWEDHEKEWENYTDD